MNSLLESVSRVHARTLGVSCSLAIAASAAAQQPQPELIVNPNALRVSVPGAVNWLIFGAPNRVYALFADPQPGPSTLLGRPLNLGLSRDLVTVDFGALSATGAAQGLLSFTPPAAMAGSPIYLQHLEFEASSLANLRAGTPDAVAFHGGRFAVVENFRTLGQRWSGNFDRSALYRLQAAPVRRRTHRTIDPQGVPFAPGVANPLNPYGSRTQMVFRPVDVGATGETEQLTAIRWRPAGVPVTETFTQLDLLVNTTAVLPDYTTDPFTALPAAPQSGLDSAFAANAPTLQVVFAGAYTVDLAAQTASGYMPYPMSQEFTYDGVSSLLVEVRAAREAIPRAPTNGQRGRTMLQSSSLPAARMVAQGSATQPLGIPLTGSGDNLLYDYELDFVRDTSEATSPWLGGGAPAPDYDPPIVAAQVPAGTSYQLQFRGASNSQGISATPWAATQDIADGRAFIQVRVQFVANRATGAVPYIDTLAIPAR